MDFEDLKDFKFNLTENIQNMLIDMLVIKQMLEEKKVEEVKLPLLEKRIDELRTKFITEFRKANEKEIKEFLKLLDK